MLAEESWKPDVRRVPSLFLIKDFFIVTVKLNGDSIMLKFKLLFYMYFRTISLVWFASMVSFLTQSELILFVFKSNLTLSSGLFVCLQHFIL